MPNALISSLAIIEDVEGESLVHNINTDWLQTNPMTIVWADKIYVPQRYSREGQAFGIDVGFDKSNEVLSEVITTTWNRLIRDKVIEAVPVGPKERETARWARTTVQNRLDQTEEQNSERVRVNRRWGVPPELLTLENHCFCLPQLDAIAAQVMLCQSTRSVLLCDDRENQSVTWFLNGGLNPEIQKQPAARMVIGQVRELLLPRWEIIPPVAGCARCGANGDHCYDEDYGPRDWIMASASRLERLLEIRHTDEAALLRRVIDEITERLVKAAERGTIDFEFEARRELISAFQKARKRMERDFRKIEKYCGLLTLFALTPQWVAETLDRKELALLGLAFQSVSTASLEMYRNFVCARNSWINIKEIAAEETETFM